MCAATQKQDKAPYSALSRWYDAFMDDFDYPLWCDFYCEIAGLKRGMSILEAACGTGLMTRRLAKRGLKIIATDISEEMLHAAGNRLRSAGIMNTQFILMDMRKLSLHRPCDAVICACDGVNYLTEGVEEFFRGAYDALKTGGVLAFDISSYDKLSAMDGQLFYDDRDDATCFWNASFDGETSVTTLELSIFTKDENDDETYRRQDETHRMKAYKQAEIVDLLYKTGFVDINIYGDYLHFRANGAEKQQDSPVQEEKRLHFVAVKA